ncbi:hypothetical protein IDM40_26945 [Nocardiopsis sp. HNM0947]|uniref:ABC-2 type transport system permease protein n=1 Tax=Nocardiopsis coralli TaxID=2772213 RepID=A0ABR9PEN3_9ACTN|nr:hypothetical protein [Nocardiopsis coralli]MBE3002310.1 hypothetical protein [Nocardiopsis coralli]
MKDTAPTIAAHNPGRATVFTRAFSAELAKTASLRGWWIGAALVLALTTYFAHMGATLLVELVETLEDGAFTDLDGARVPLEQGVVETVLSSPYQSMALFFPLVVAVVVGQEYRHGQIQATVMAVPARGVLAAAKITAVCVLTLVVCTAAYLLSSTLLWFVLPEPAAGLVLGTEALLTLPRIMLYAVCMALVSGALTTVFRSTLIALFAVVGILVLTVSGLLSAFVPPVHDVLPMIAAQSFLFGHAVEGVPSAGAGLLTLLAWAVVAAVLWTATLIRRDAV